MEKLKIDFSDFGGFNHGQGINKYKNIFVDILRSRYKVEISDKPDLLIYSDVGGSELHKLYSCRKIFWTGESNNPDLTYADGAMTPLILDDDRHINFPYYLVSTNFDCSGLIKETDYGKRIVEQKRTKCSFVVSNIGKSASYRINFFKKLSKHMQVASGGRALNNIGAPVNDKMAFLGKFKYNIAMENKSLQGYTTEKIVDSMLAGAIPIYYGNPSIGQEFNPASFIDVSRYQSIDKVIEYIMEIEETPALYQKYLSEPFLHDNKPSIFFEKQRYLNFITDIINKDFSRKRKKKSLFGRWVIAKAMKSY